MVLPVHGEPEKEINWSTASEFIDKKKNARVSAPASYFIQECKPFAVNWALCYLWCGIRTDWWSARCWIDNCDPARLGGNYQSIREGVRMACTEFNKYVDTSMINEQDELEKCYSEMVAFAKGENPSCTDPVIEPPKPTPLPPLPEPKPEPDKQDLPNPDKPVPGKGFNWKWLIPIIIPVLSALTALLPAPFNLIGKLILQAIGAAID